jgi:hypothetical protein
MRHERVSMDRDAIESMQGNLSRGEPADRRQPRHHRGDHAARMRWMRMFGQTIFAVGAITYVPFVFGLSPGQSYRPERQEGADLDPAYAPVPGARAT